MNILLKTMAVFFLLASNVQAHMLWVNAFESSAHKPGHVTTSLGWGHVLPIDDVTNSVNARITLDKYFVMTPDGKQIPLHLPGTKLAEPFLQNDTLDLYEADIACRKISMKETSPHGVYLIAAESQKAFHTRYIDSKGRKRFALKPKNKIKDLKKVLFAVQYQAFAKSYVTVGKWVQPKPIGQGLEITPLTDLSNVKVGDMVEFDVRFNGQPLSYGPNGIEYITASSPSFGKNGKFYLFSYISKGKAQFQVQSAGQWLVNVFHNEPVTADGPLKELHDKVTNVGSGATLTFTVE